MNSTGDMTFTTDRFQRVAMRTHFAQRCSLPEFAGFEVSAGIVSLWAGL
jgi:hypothetical protein